MITKELIASLIDLTSLNTTDTKLSIAVFSNNASTKLGDVAAVCIYNEFIPLVKKLVHSNIKIATVANFPSGQEDITLISNSITKSLQAGADEIDLVIPYHEFLSRGVAGAPLVTEVVTSAKKLCKNHTLKCIIESGELHDAALIKAATLAVIKGGGDFVKTSTGKTTTGATLAAAEVILKTIKKSPEKIGFKVSGGVKTFAEAVDYINLASNILGPDYINKSTFRIGASSLLLELLKDN